MKEKSEAFETFKIFKALVEDERINYVCVADYSPNSTLEKIVKLMIENMAMMEQLKNREEKQLKQYLKVNENEN